MTQENDAGTAVTSAFMSASDSEPTSAPMLEDLPGRAVMQSPDGPNHRLVIGDNLAAMRAMLPEYKGAVDAVYIDPPYNTGHASLAYDDDRTGEDGRNRHAAWTAFMRPRLEAALPLMADDAVIFASIDDNEQAHLRLLMDDVFGEDCFLATLAVSNLPSGRSMAKRFAVNHEYVHVYAKRPDCGYVPRIRLDSVDASYNREDNRGRYRLVGLVNSHRAYGPWNRPNLRYPLYVSADDGSVRTQRDSNHALEVLPAHADGREAVWTWGRPKATREADLLVGLHGRGGWRVYRRDYLRAGRTSRMRTFLGPDIMGTTASAGRELAAIVGPGRFYGAKPVAYVSRLLESLQNPHATVLDFFAGSGTTAEAVARLNHADGGDRECILITDRGLASADPDAEDVAELAYERVSRVLTGRGWADGGDHEPLGGNLLVSQVI